MGLEFLHTDDDVEEFINYLYEHGFFISHRCREMRGIVLEQTAAIHELRNDLYTSWSTYYIGDATNSLLLVMDSCGPQSHPSKLGRQGRRAGAIRQIDKESVFAKELMRLLRNYFRRNYKFLKYNGAARMSCHFGPHYLQMETVFFADPRSKNLCVGYLCVICYSCRTVKEKESASNALKQLDVQNVQIFEHQYLQNPELTQLCIPFLYHMPSFSAEAYSSAFSKLSSDGQICFSSGQSILSFKNRLSPELLKDQPKANCIYILLQKPW